MASCKVQESKRKFVCSVIRLLLPIKDMYEGNRIKDK